MPGRLPAVLLGLFLVAAAVSGIHPYDRSDWLLENALVAALLATLLVGHRRPLSGAAYLALFAFLLLHELGAHYTYSQVPWAQWWHALVGVSLPPARNPFDRAVHFAYGLLLAPAVADWMLARTPLRPGAALRVVVVALLTAGSALYEMIEWAAAEAFGGSLGVAYLGTQGDAWDAQKDMAIALLGSVTWALLPRRISRA